MLLFENATNKANYQRGLERTLVGSIITCTVNWLFGADIVNTAQVEQINTKVPVVKLASRLMCKPLKNHV